MSTNNDDYAQYACAVSEMTAEEFFGGDAGANFDYWSKTAFWTIEEATALSFGFEPRIVNLDRLTGESHDFAHTFRDRHELLRRAVQVGELPATAPPKDYIRWMASKTLTVAPEVSQMLSAKLRPKSDAVDTKERRGWQKVCLALAVGGYRYKPGLARNAVHGEMLKDFENMGLGMDLQTLSTYLNSAAGEFKDRLRSND